MSFNPFEQKPENIEKLFCDWKTMYPQSYSKNDVSPFTKLRCILTSGVRSGVVFASIFSPLHKQRFEKRTCADQKKRASATKNRRVFKA